MPRGVTSKWSNKDDRMYEHVKESNEKRGVGAKRAEEIAARTVNKFRKDHGKTHEQYAAGHAKTSGRAAPKNKGRAGGKTKGTKRK